MKFLLALVISLSSFTVFSADSETTAPEVFKSLLPLGIYNGHNDNKEVCQVIVSEVNFPKKDIKVEVVTPNFSLTKLIDENSEAYYNMGTRKFVQTEHKAIASDEFNYIEKIIRTNAVGNSGLYVVLEHSFVVNRSRDTEISDCIISL
jgi:hypothetical protein